jgi:hypothetical protein
MSDGDQTFTTNTEKMLAFIAQCEDTAKLKALIKNARERRATELAEAAFRKLIAIVPAEAPGTVAHDLWQTINAFEHILTDERGRTTRLARTRQKIARVGEVQTLRDWALGRTETDGFRMLLERNMPELTGEAIVLRHRGQFDPSVVDAARQRLIEAGVDLAALPEPS